MGFKEDLEARRQREEAKRYFRSNNPYYFSTETWIKMIVVGLLMALGCGALYGLFVMLTNIQMSYILGLVGIAIAKALKKISGVGNEKVGILTLIFYFLSIIFSHVFSIALVNYMVMGSVAVLFSPTVWQAAIASLFSGSYISGIVLIIGALYAYNYANQ